MSISSEWNKLLTWNKKHSSSFLKCFHFSDIVPDPRVGFEKVLINSLNIRSETWRWSLQIYCKKIGVYTTEPCPKLSNKDFPSVS